MQISSHLRAAAGITALLLSSAWSKPVGAAGPCTGGIGQWNWFIGGQVTLSQDNAVRWTGSGSIPPTSGTWKCDPKVGKYVVTWPNGFVDTLSLSPDGSKLSGVSSTGVAVSGARVGKASGNPPAASGAATGATPAPPATTAGTPTVPPRPPTSGAVDHNPSVREILQDRPKPDPRGWKQDRSGGPQKGPKPQ